MKRTTMVYILLFVYAVNLGLNLAIDFTEIRAWGGWLCAILGQLTLLGYVED